MTIELRTPGVDDLGDVVGALRAWQHDASPLQLHPGDLGWAWQYGEQALAASLRTWGLGGDVVAIGMLDSPDVLRLTVAPELRRDDALARRIVADVAEPDRGVLPAGRAAVESPNGTLVQDLLTATGWKLDEPWTPLRRDLAHPVEEPAIRVEPIGPERAAEYAAIHGSSFGRNRFTAGLWQTMAAGIPYADASSLLGFDDAGTAVAVVTVWSAGPGRPGLLEPMGVHADHHGRGYGRAITLAAAAELRRRGASSAVVCTPTSRVAAVATYESAGFVRGPERLDRSR